MENVRGVQVFSDGGYASRDGARKKGAAAVVCVVVPKEGGKEEYYLRNNGWAGGRLAASIAGDKMDDKKLTLV